MDNILVIHTAEDIYLYDIAILFDQYRIFYKQPSNLSKAKSFLEERMKNKESVIFIAYLNGRPAGFTQLYPSFSSVTMERMYILNDLFVHPDFRGNQVGSALLKHAQKFTKDLGYKGLALATAVDNSAQKLYEKLGWVKDEDFFHYFWKA